MKDNIPNEIITNIATYLSQQDLYACICVCRSWNTALTPALYNSVNIQSQEQLDGFIGALRRTERSNPLGHFVRKMTGSRNIGRDGLAFLQRLCPFVVEFDTQLCFWYPELAEDLEGWKHLTKAPCVVILTGPPNFSLDFLKKHVQRLELHIKGYPEWINLMTELPCVEELRIDGYESNPDVSLSDLETVHKALPRLNSLELWSISIRGEMPDHVAPCNTVRRLQLSLNDSHLWGLYFARKYTHLENLDIFWLEYTPNMLSEAKTLTRSCRGLKWFRIRVTEGDEHSVSREHLLILREIGAPLTELEFLDVDVPEYATIISGFRATVSKIIIRPGDGKTDEDILEPLKACQNLEHLDIYGNFEDVFRLDYCLNSCKNLKTLTLLAPTIGLTKNCTTNYQHGLESLYISGKYDIEDEVYPYLSQHCPLLSKLSCHYGPYCERSREIYIPSPNIIKMDIHCFGELLYKVIAAESPEHNGIHCASIGEQHSHDQEEWHLQGSDKDDDFVFRQLDALEVDQISGQLCKTNGAHGSEESEQSDAEHRLPSYLRGLPIATVTCYSRDRLELLFQG
ncbi:hypothetical protein DFQ28_005417 [Apophysomyces sp. BC1034]|nr:hypothetical protein DFQ30_010971 [Apophysomyces sp. BC1015]KAG0182311.1 hypothetical protein DFQ29_004864 [Apophysomyces sp. BC1021]KAG0193413.1 hypothetical protein DFQ28_005417 [Apophysomyces sp. BC1034]